MDVQESGGMQELLSQYHENKLSHAFLLETNDAEQCFHNLLLFLAFINRNGDEMEDKKLENLIVNESLPSLVVIRPDGQNIKKEQILELKRFFQTKPTFSRYNMYVILEAELLNSSSANTILKFLEEPEDNILGFFITNNKENIIETIKSRCQIVIDYYEGQTFVNVPKVWEAIAINYIKEIQLVSNEALLYNKNVVLPLVHEKKELLYLFQSIFQIFDVLNKVKIGYVELPENYNELKFLLKKDVSFFLRELKYLDGLLNEINYNLNIQLLLDRYVLEERL